MTKEQQLNRARQLALDGHIHRAARIVQEVNTSTFAEAKALVQTWLAPSQPQPVTFTVPVTFRVLMAPGWTHGHICMTGPGTVMNMEGKPCGDLSADLSGNPVVNYYPPGKKTQLVTAKANAVAIFTSVVEALSHLTLPKENPMPRKVDGK